MRSLFLILLFLVCSCSTRSKISNPFYFEAKKEEKTIRILGTMHVGFKLEDFHPSILDDIESAELVALEFDEHLMTSFQKSLEVRRQDFIKHQLFKPYQGLLKKLSVNAWKNLRYTLDVEDVTRTLEKLKVPHPVYELNPVLIQEIVVNLINRQQWYAFTEDVIGYSRNLDQRWMYHDMGSTVDREILQVARKNEQKVLALDSTRPEFIALLSDFEKNALAFLEGFFGGNEGTAKVYADLRKNYREGNEAELVKYMTQPDTEKLLVTERNEEWVPRLRWRLENNIFMAVGAGHLIGEKNLLKLLEKEGYSVKKLNLK